MWFALQARVDSHRDELMADAQEARLARLARREARAQRCGEAAAALDPDTASAAPTALPPSSPDGSGESTGAGKVRVASIAA
jgi:hypothetical protein